MPYDVNNDVRIYYETEGNGPPLLFTHGLTSSHQMWREYGYVDQLKDDFTTIIYDLRGHGQSDKPHEPQARPIAWGQLGRRSHPKQSVVQNLESSSVVPPGAKVSAPPPRSGHQLHLQHT